MYLMYETIHKITFRGLIGSDRYRDMRLTRSTVDSGVQQTRDATTRLIEQEQTRIIKYIINHHEYECNHHLNSQCALHVTVTTLVFLLSVLAPDLWYKQIDKLKRYNLKNIQRKYLCETCT